MRTPATTTSSASLNGEANPSPKIGAATSWIASAASATKRAILTRVGGVGALEGAVELVGSIGDLLGKWLCDGIDGGVELLDRGRPEQDRVDAGPRRRPLIGEFHRRAARLDREAREGLGQIEEAVAQ